MVSASSTPLAKPKVYETQTIRLTSRMLHIGSAVSRLNPFEYVPTSNWVYLPDSDALARSLQSRGFLNDYVQRIEARESISNLLEDALGENWWTTKGPDDNPLFPKHRRLRRWSQEPITDLRPMIRNGFGQHYIPGSSIKGAMRTAIAYYLLKHDEEHQVPQAHRLSAIEKKLQQSMGELKRKSKFFDDETFMDALFTDFSLEGNRSRVRNGPNTDFMRAVHISDSNPLTERKIERSGKPPIVKNHPVATEVIVSSRFSDHRAKYRASLYVEMLFNVDATFTITLDHDMLSGFKHNQGMQLPFNSVSELLAICQEFIQEQWDFEYDYWNVVKDNPRAAGKNLDFTYVRDFYSPENSPYTLRLGWASGLRGTTINLLMPEETVSEIRDTCGLKAPGFEAPKSRRTVVNHKGEIRYVPGWVKLEVR